LKEHLVRGSDSMAGQAVTSKRFSRGFLSGCASPPITRQPSRNQFSLLPDLTQPQQARTTKNSPHCNITTLAIISLVIVLIVAATVAVAVPVAAVASDPIRYYIIAHPKWPLVH